jgi:HSP20 family protein
MAEQVPVRREQNLPAVQEGEVLPAWREPGSMFRDIDTIFDRMVRSVFGSWPGGLGPAVDIEETNDAYTVEIDLPGFRRDDISVEAGQNELHISGQIVERERTGIMRHRTRRSGQFSYRVALPAGTDADAITAAHKDGVLTVTVPRSEAFRPRRIDIV